MLDSFGDAYVRVLRVQQKEGDGCEGERKREKEREYSVPRTLKKCSPGEKRNQYFLI